MTDAAKAPEKKLLTAMVFLPVPQNPKNSKNRSRQQRQAHPTYCVSGKLQPQVRNIAKKTLIFLKKGIDFIENIAIIG